MGRFFLILSVILLGLGTALPPAYAQGVPLDHLPALRGGYFRHDSPILGRALHIYIRLPADYAAQPERRYPIVYLLDGDSLFPILAANHLFLTYDEQMPEAIVVGIAYGGFDEVNRREIDYTLRGAQAFQTMLKTELLPEVERRYRADPARRILFGQAKGGFFVLYSAFTDPDLFWGRILSNFSSDPDNGLFSGPAPTATRTDLRIAVAIGTRDRQHRRDRLLAFTGAWQGRAGAPWTVRRIDIEGGVHSADSARAYRAGMLWLFDLPDPLRAP